MLLLLSVVAVIFHNVLGYHHRVDAQIDLERATLLTLKNLGRECSESSWDSFWFESEGLIFGNPRDIELNFLLDPDNEPMWSGFICYSLYGDEEERDLVKQVDYFTSPVSTVPDPVDISPRRDLDWFRSSDISARVIQKNVDLFSVTQELVEEGFENQVLAIELRATTGGEKRFSYEVKTRVQPRN